MSTAVATSSVVVPPLELTAGETRFYQSEGYLMIPGLLRDAVAAELYEEVMGIMRVIGGFESSTLRQTSDHLEGTRLHDLIHSDNLRRLAGQLMEGPASLYLPFTAVKGSGGGKFNFHQDNNYTRFDGPGINLWFALMDMTPENGCLMLVPRSHRQGDVESETADGHRKVKVEPADFLPLRMRAGDCVAFSRLTIHGSGPNTTPDPRVGYAVQYFRDDVTFLDRQSGEHKSLLQFSPHLERVKPVQKISAPTKKLDGH